MSAPSPAKRPKFFMVNPSQTTANTLWSWFVLALIVALLGSLTALIWFSADGKNVDTLVTIFTALLTGLIGVFAPQPGGD
jgi:H+/Cl- antiporter ClcA